MKPYLGGHKVRTRKSQIVASWLGLIQWSKLRPGIYPFSVTFRFSTSIKNFVDRVTGRHDVYHWHPIKSLYDPTAFVGLYHEGDWLRFLWHRGLKLAFWCGGDILRLQQKPFWQWLLRRVKADHVCENEVEQEALKKMGITSRIHPILFFDDVNDYPLSYKYSEKPHVWLTCHPGREDEYGVTLVEEIADQVPEVTFHVFGISMTSGELKYRLISIDYGQKWHPKNVIYHGHVPSTEMDKMIRGYQCGLRTLDFDGCPHTVTKGVLLGQWSINKIPYPYTDSYNTKEELVELLKNLKNKKEPNMAGREYWLKIVSQFPWQ